MRGGEITEEGEEEKDRGKGGPSICPGPKWGPTVPPDGPSILSHALLSAPSSGTFPEKALPAPAARERAFSPLSPLTSSPIKGDGVKQASTSQGLSRD